jgi:hypothetical protein
MQVRFPVRNVEERARRVIRSDDWQRIQRLLLRWVHEASSVLSPFWGPPTVVRQKTCGVPSCPACSTYEQRYTSDGPGICTQLEHFAQVRAVV